MFSPPLLGQRRLNMLWEQPAHWPLESPLPVGSATPRATSTSSPPTLDNGALFALTASLPMTPTLSANNLGFPEPESSTVQQLVQQLVATTLVLCPVPSESSPALSPYQLYLLVLAWGALPLLRRWCRSSVALISLTPLILVLPLHLLAPPTKLLVWSVRPSILLHLK